MANLSSLLSPRSLSNSLHRPWEQENESEVATPSSTSSSSAVIFAFPSPVSSQSAPATPSGLSSHAHLFSSTSSSRNAYHHPMLHPSFYVGSPSPFLLTNQSSSTSAGSDNVNNLPRSPCLPNSLGSPFSPFPWSGPFAMQSFATPLPSMPFAHSLNSPSAHSTPNNHQNLNCASGTSGLSSRIPSSSASGIVKNENASPVMNMNGHNNSKTSPPKKKRKPPPISIDSSINNFSAEAAQFQNMMSMSAGLISPTLSSAPLPSPLLSAQYHHFQEQQHNLSNAMRYIYEGPLTPAIPSSGYGSVDGPLYSPLNFAFLCFFPGTRIKLLCAEDSPSQGEWRSVEDYRDNNINLQDHIQGLHLINTVKGESDQNGNTVELTFKAIDQNRTVDKDAIHIKAVCSPSHPFYEFQKGWVSLDPHTTREMYGLQCHHLKTGDNLTTNPPERVEMGWHNFDAGSNLLADWNIRNRRAMSMDSLGLHDPRSGWTMPSVMQSSTPREVKPRIKKEKKEKKDDKAKRPMNAFMLFAQRYRVLYTQRFPGRDNRAISCLLGDHWKGLDSDERQKFTDEAKNLAEMYKEKNPDCWKRRSRSRSDSEAQLIVVDSPNDHQTPLAPNPAEPNFEQVNEPTNPENSVFLQIKAEAV